MAKHKYKRKMFKYRLKKIPIIIVCFAFLFAICLWRTISNYQFEKQLALRSEEILSALGSRNCVDLVKPENDTTRIKGEITVPVNGKDNYFLIIIISSLPSNVIRRNVIRNSWAKTEHTGEAIVRFFMGKPKTPEENDSLKVESITYGDIIVDDFEEHYYRLTVKSMRILRWFLQNRLPATQFVAKTDDDVYVNVTNLISYTKQNVATTENYSSFIGGELYLTSPIEKDPYSKWYVPREFLLWGDHVEIFPPFVGGPFYLMHVEVTKKLLEKCPTVPMFHLEDVYISGILGSYYLKIFPKSIPNVYSTVSKAYWPVIHHYYVKYMFNTKSLIAYHTYSTPELMKLIYTSSTT